MRPGASPARSIAFAVCSCSGRCGPHASAASVTPAFSRIDRAAVNRYGRPVRFTVTDTNGTKYSLTGEELRWAVNTDAPKDGTLFSSFIEPADQGAQIKFTGHGFGHGVGMCQWCAQTRALQGMRHETIVLQAYPGSQLVRAY